MALELYINNQRIEQGHFTVGAIPLSFESSTKLDEDSTTVVVEIDHTPYNMRILGTTIESNLATPANTTTPMLSLQQNGIVIVEGWAHLRSQLNNGQGRQSSTYEVCLTPLTWITKASKKRFWQSNIPCPQRLSAATIMSSWSSGVPIRFLPVQRNRFISDQGLSHFPSAITTLTYQDYHPFIHLRTAMESIVAEHGYQIQSQFMDTALFDSLHISGNYKRRNVDKMRASMDFAAGRFASTSATADFSGRVWASAVVKANSVGNIVDTADPNQISSTGTRINWAFNTNECFGVVNNVPTFKPLYTLSAAAHFRLRYCTEYKMLNREQLTGFDTIALDDGVVHKFQIPNIENDHRSSIMGNMSYMVIAFSSYVSGDTYQLRYKNAEGATVAGVTFSARTALITTLPGKVSAPELWYRKAETSNFIIYTNDWAIYSGYVTETGSLDVEVDITSMPKEISPSSPMLFNKPYFSGAKWGMKLTLYNTTKVSPIFDPAPGENTPISMESLCNHSFSQIELFRAMQHLFNLVVYCDHLNKKIYIEPRESFFDTANPVNWSSKIDRTKPIEQQVAGSQSAATVVVGYKDSNSNPESRPLVINNINAPLRGSAKEQLNKIFCTSATNKDVFPYAKAAYMIQAGDGADPEPVRDDLHFEPKIISYMGMEPLPPEQRWGWPSFGVSYPLAAFEIAQKGLNLFFDPQGLGEYYQGEQRRLNNATILSLHLRLTPEDIEPLLRPNDQRQDLRGAIKLNIDGEDALYTLQQIDNIAIQRGESTRVRLIKIV